MRRTPVTLALLCLVALLVGCDQGTKRLASQHLRGRPAVELVAGVLDLRYTENPDGAFSSLRVIPPSVRRPLLVAAGAALSLLLALVVVLRRELTLERVGLAVILAGGLGNLVDRLVRGGRVVDFIHVHHWPVFNVADILVGVGVGLVLLHHFRSPRATDLTT